ncbi:unnamed protein product [Chondrus crispus]|uniref:Uncharacterized protein n=1 Tax=Chondrus crispus TaxID=2769 RepID=R7Q6N3_CHOCR|nr:unnamed protein product [Chondrus crispus]CDF33130.1 unnamed protein product [Chondrus crispus]|eukprot:XP_005712933.1 unnamed protein product [Chondrus crispus]
MEWQLKDSFTNPSQFHSAVPYTREIESSVTTSRSEVESIAREESKSTSTSISLDVSAQIKIFNVSANTTVGWTSSVVNTSMHEASHTNAETKETSQKIGPISIEPGESVYVFEKKIKFPTISWETGELTVWPSADIPTLNEDVLMKIPVHEAPIKYLKDIKVHTYGAMTYSKDFMLYKDGLSGESKNVERENWGDINRGYGGKYVFLEPVWVDDISQGADNISVQISGGVPGWTKERGQQDMAMGAGGDYRFLDIWHRRDVKEKIVDVVLWGGQLVRIPDGWTGMTGDLNKGRGGRYLYIVWKTASG